MDNYDKEQETVFICSVQKEYLSVLEFKKKKEVFLEQELFPWSLCKGKL